MPVDTWQVNYRIRKARDHGGMPLTKGVMADKAAVGGGCGAHRWRERGTSGIGLPCSFLGCRRTFVTSSCQASPSKRISPRGEALFRALGGIPPVDKKFAQFLLNDRKVLRFKAYWDDHTPYGARALVLNEMNRSPETDVLFFGGCTCIYIYAHVNPVFLVHLHGFGCSFIF